MRRVCRAIVGTALVGALAVGCGSTSDEGLVLSFQRWDSTGITQADSVRPTSADVDVVQSCCALSMEMTVCETVEPFTVTSINATFRNEEASDIHLDGYVIHFNDPRTGLGDVRIAPGGGLGSLEGGRCSNASDRQCAVDADCAIAGSLGRCEHSETTIEGLVLFDLSLKEHVNLCGRSTTATSNPCLPPGETTTLSVTFFGSDAHRSFETVAGYAAVFDNFNNCESSGGGSGAS